MHVYGHAEVELTGLRLYRRKNRCRKLTTRKTTFQTITSRLHLYRDAHKIKRPHPAGDKVGRRYVDTSMLEMNDMKRNMNINIQCSPHHRMAHVTRPCDPTFHWLFSPEHVGNHCLVKILILIWGQGRGLIAAHKQTNLLSNSFRLFLSTVPSVFAPESS